MHEPKLLKRPHQISYVSHPEIKSMVKVMQATLPQDILYLYKRPNEAVLVNALIYLVGRQREEVRQEILRAAIEVLNTWTTGHGSQDVPELVLKPHPEAEPAESVYRPLGGASWVQTVREPGDSGGEGLKENHGPVRKRARPPKRK